LTPIQSNLLVGALGALFGPSTCVGQRLEEAPRRILSGIRLLAPPALTVGHTLAVKLDGSVAIVTGASSGIGAFVAVELARRGARVVAAARRADRLADTIEDCKKHSPDSMTHVADLSRRVECEGLISATEARFGRVDIIVNNAGISVHKNAASTTAEDIERVMALNFFAPMYVTMAALPGMIDRGVGSVVNVTSVAGYVPNPGESAYGASKAALSRWSHGLAVDLHGTGVHVGVLSPGPIDTEIWSLDEALSYRGKLFPPDVVAQGVARMVEHTVTHLTMPRRYGAVGALYPLLGRPMRWGLRRYERRAQR
jgi:short-subunit dehydrogenase